jgi:hypothetical protein
VTSHNQRSNSFSVLICHASWIMDKWRFCHPIGWDWCWQINGTSRPTSPWANIAHICINKSSNVRANITPRSRRAGNPAERTIQCTAICTWWTVTRLRVIPLLAKCPNRVNYPDFHITSEDHAAWIINLQTGRGLRRVWSRFGFYEMGCWPNATGVSHPLGAIGGHKILFHLKYRI